MNKKRNRLVWVALASLTVAGCSAQGSVEIQETIVINEDVQLESSLADSSLEVSRQQDIEVGRNIKNSTLHKEFFGKEIYFNENGGLYSLNLDTGVEKKLVNREVISISNDGKRALSFQGEEVFVHDLQTGKRILLGNESMKKPDYSEYGFTNDEGNALVHFDYETDIVSLIDVDTNKMATWDLRGYDMGEISLSKKVKDEVFITARSEEAGFGIYQLNAQGYNTLVTPSGKDTSFTNFDILQNGSVIFNGTYGGKTGVFYWDKETWDVQLLVSGGKSKEGIWVPFYNLSPDESKILFDTPVQIEDDFKTNVYMAELVDGQLANSVRIMENADLYSVITYSGHWSEDSKTAYITTVRNTEYIGNIAVFNVNN
ncbi:hypothetical protein [Sporosarcina sp. FSL K6-3457]|uniref:hypothetical protein n=1 Tax=Sporosarcina sp. FSL K6-3457 TaxID=2978204 RepID=UPI0030F82D42